MTDKMISFFRQAETMTQKDAMKFPLVGSCVLFGLYLLFKFIGKEYVNALLTFYFLAIGVICVGGFFEPFIAKIVPKSILDKPTIKFDKFKNRE